MPAGRVLITGAGGFLGSHLCERFLREGYEVVGVDNFITGSRRNMAALEQHPNFSLIEHDITHPLYVVGRVDLVLHFASPASPKDYLRHPIHTMKVSSLG
ncbi:MAG: NAD-dependent epimerase/dehydratase family protein, partial [Armatimonadetes bacterium]|nr:NAD-dependent epimerase/dehydratase family protein [Armatimonadota bacterium]